MAAQASMILIAIHLTSAPGIPLKTVQTAQQEAEQILASAAVRPEWNSQAGLHLRITGSTPKWAVHDATGYARLIEGDPGYAEVSWPAVARSAEEMEVDPHLLLGAAIAHEIGHLLFGPAHSHSGVMSARLGPAEMRLAAHGTLRFEGAIPRLTLAAGR
jgi:hypothetical protein